jgi:NAD(P)H-dependent FMN reductase
MPLSLLTSSAVEVVGWRVPRFTVLRCLRVRSSERYRGGQNDQHYDAISTGRAMRSTIALFSSSRRLGNTRQLMDRIALELNIEVADLTSLRISPYDNDHANRNDDFEPLMKHVLTHDQVIFATPIYWYAVSPAMKIFLDRFSDLLELPDLLSEGRTLRGKNAYVLCTSIGEEPSAEFMGAFRETFRYLGMRFGGAVHINCRDGYLPAVHEPEALRFAELVKAGRSGSS